MTAFLLIAFGVALMFGALSLRQRPWPRGAWLLAGLLGVVTAAVGAFRL
jgi:hypothetical protein